MPEGWDFYGCKVEGGRASILLNLDLRQEAPRRDLPLLVYIRVNMKRPQKDGMPSPLEASPLREVEDRLEEQLKTLEAIYVGRLTHGGAREYYYYAPQESGLRRAVDEALSGTGYAGHLGGHRDPDWEHYLRFLMPNRVEYQGIINRRMVKRLERRGDGLTAPREVRHWLSFPGVAARDRFLTDIRSAWTPYDPGDVEGSMTTPLLVTCLHSVDLDTVNQVVGELQAAALQEGGAYDGWETPLVTGA